MSAIKSKKAKNKKCTHSDLSEASETNSSKPESLVGKLTSKKGPASIKQSPDKESLSKRSIRRDQSILRSQSSLKALSTENIVLKKALPTSNQKSLIKKVKSIARSASMELTSTESSGISQDGHLSTDLSSFNILKRQGKLVN